MQERNSVGPLITVEEVEAYLQLDRMTIYKLAKAGEIPALKIGRQWRFPSIEYLDAWFRQKALNSTIKT